jgi:hypothetical protein
MKRSWLALLQKGVTVIRGVLPQTGSCHVIHRWGACRWPGRPNCSLEVVTGDLAVNDFDSAIIHPAMTFIRTLFCHGSLDCVM